VSISHELEKTMKKLIVMSLSAAALIAAMSTPARADHAETIIGAVIGTTVGTMIGHDVGGRRGSVIGAVVGAATGATIGHDVGRRRYERVEYYPEPVYRAPRQVERVIYVPVDEPRVIYAPPRRDYDDCDEREHGRRERHHGHDRHHERRYWN
jgi:YMGG-like Gly-zipper